MRSVVSVRLISFVVDLSDEDIRVKAGDVGLSRAQLTPGPRYVPRH